MTVSDSAGKPADPSILVDVDALVGAYYDRVPDPADPAQRVAFGTSGHRGSSFRGAFNEAHIVAISEAICRYRRSQGTDGPLFIGRDTHALSEPATRTALEVLVANGVDVRVDADDGYTPTPAVSHAIVVANRDRTDGRGLADGIVVTPSHNPPDDGGFKYNPPNGGPADTDVTRWIEDEANRILEAQGADGIHGVARVKYAWARANATEYDFLGRYVDDLGCGHRHGGHRELRAPHRRRPDGRRLGRLLGSDRRALPPRPHRHERDRRSALGLHDLRLGRQDPDGPVVAVRDGRPRRPPRPLRRRPRQRRRCGSPRRRDPGGRPAEPEPLPVGRDRLPLRRCQVAGAPRSASARRSSRRA